MATVHHLTHTTPPSTVFHRARNAHLDPRFTFVLCPKQTSSKSAFMSLFFHPRNKDTSSRLIYTRARSWLEFWKRFQGARPTEQPYSVLLTVCLLFQTRHYLNSNIHTQRHTHKHTHAHSWYCVSKIHKSNLFYHLNSSIQESYCL